MADVIVLGYITADFIVESPTSLNDSADATLANIELRPGGSGANVAAWLHYLDIPVTLYAFVGNDNLGRAILEDVRPWMNITRLGSTPKIISLASAGGERKLLVDRGGPFDSAKLPIPRDYRGWIHVPAFMLYRPDLYSIALSTLRHFAPHCAVSIDINSAAFLANFGIDRVFDIIKEIEPTVVAMNELEGKAISDLTDLARHVRYLVVHRGKRPSLLWQDGTSLEVSTGIEANNPVVDSTGAGDALLAGFISSAIYGSTAPEALAHGHRVAQEAIGLIGGFPPR